MIVVEPRGRLGNRMFQYAFGVAAARKLGTRFWMEGSMLRAAFVLEGRRHHALGMLHHSLALRTYGFTMREVAGDEDPAQVLDSLTDRTRYGGYFQSALYFAAEQDRVARLFTPRAEHRRAFVQAHPRHGDHVAVHVRRGDYATWRGDMRLPSAWYRRCIDLLDVSRATPIFFVSDDLAWAAEEFADVPGARFVPASELVDLQLLMTARWLVLSPSSFSWWGAWLNESVERVLVPRHWLGFRDGAEYPACVVAPGWEQIEVDQRHG